MIYILMLKIKRLLAILLTLIVLSCQEEQSKIELIEADNLTSEQIDSVLMLFKFQYESPIVLDSTNQVLIPISTELLEKRTKFSKDGYGLDEYYPRYWNILFYNRQTNESRLLTEEKIRISAIHTGYNEYENTYNKVKNKVLYDITKDDFNKDGRLDSKDPEYLFSSEITGENLKRISPLNEDLRYFEVIPKSEQILIKTFRDTNRDSVFNQKDELIWYKAELVNYEWQINEIVDSVLRKRIENLYFNQWLKKK